MHAHTHGLRRRGERGSQACDEVGQACEGEERHAPAERGPGAVRGAREEVVERVRCELAARMRNKDSVRGDRSAVRQSMRGRHAHRLDDRVLGVERVHAVIRGGKRGRGMLLALWGRRGGVCVRVVVGCGAIGAGEEEEVAECVGLVLRCESDRERRKRKKGKEKR